MVRFKLGQLTATTTQFFGKQTDYLHLRRFFLMFANERRCAKLLLVFFAIHNLEEISHFSQDLEKLPYWVRAKGPWRDRNSFALATALLTAVVGALSKRGHRSKEIPHAILLGGPSAALAGNALSHVVRAVFQRRYNGGLLTAPIMGLFSVRVFFLSTRSISDCLRRRIFIFGNIAAFPSILGSLYLGLFINRLLKNLYNFPKYLI